MFRMEIRVSFTVLHRFRPLSFYGHAKFKGSNETAGSSGKLQMQHTFITKLSAIEINGKQALFGYSVKNKKQKQESYD